MNLITGIATVALIAGSVEVSSAGCGKCAADLEETRHDHAGAVEAEHQHANQLTQCVLEAFSKLGTERVNLVNKADGGCDKSATALVEDEIEAVAAMIEALEHEESRRILRLGMMLQAQREMWKSNPAAGVDEGQFTADEFVVAPERNDSFDGTLDDIRKRLEAQLDQYQVSTADNRVEN